MVKRGKSPLISIGFIKKLKLATYIARTRNTKVITAKAPTVESLRILSLSSKGLRDIIASFTSIKPSMCIKPHIA